MPVYAGILIFFSLASLGLPSLAGFIAEFLVLLGSYQYNKILTGISCLGIILGATYLLLMIRRVLLGPLNAKWNKLKEINGREIFTLVPLMILILIIGLYPKPFLEFITPSLNSLLTSLGAVLS